MIDAVGEPRNGIMPDQVHREDEQEQRRQVRQVLVRVVLADAGDGDLVADEEEQALEQVPELARAAARRSCILRPSQIIATRNDDRAGGDQDA